MERRGGGEGVKSQKCQICPLAATAAAFLARVRGPQFSTFAPHRRISPKGSRQKKNKMSPSTIREATKGGKPHLCVSFIRSPSSFRILQRMTLHKEEGEAQTFFSFCLLSLCVALLLGASFFCSPLGLSKLIFLSCLRKAKKWMGASSWEGMKVVQKGFLLQKSKEEPWEEPFFLLPQIQIDCRCNSLFPLGGKRCLLPPPFSPNKLRL